MPNTDYILCKLENIDTHANQKQEINFVWPCCHVSIIHWLGIKNVQLPISFVSRKAGLNSGQGRLMCSYMDGNEKLYIIALLNLIM